MSIKNSVLERIHQGLEKSGVPKRGRNPLVASKTGYSSSMVAKILSGHAELGDRFIQAVCNGFDIRYEWIVNGEEPIKHPSVLIGKPDKEMLKRAMGIITDNESSFPVDENSLDRFFNSVNQAREQNIAYMKSLVDRLNNDEFKLVEEFIFELFKKRK